MFNIAARASLGWQPLRTAFVAARQTVPIISRSRTFASRSSQAGMWKKIAPAGAVCTVAGLLSYYTVSADAASTVVEVNGPGTSITVTVAESAQKQPVVEQETKPAVEQETKPAVEQAKKPSLEDIELIVCDMAGTTVMEGGVVYKTLRAAMNADGLNVSEHDMHAWHGAKKEAVIANFAKEHGNTPDGELEARVKRVAHLFEEMIHEAYFGETSKVGLIGDDLRSWMFSLQSRGTKVALDTGYPPALQKALIKKLELDTVVDGHVSSYEVADGRPAPYMIFKLMEDLGVENVRRVAKVGDTVRDIQEGKNAGCGLVIGVLSGADSEEQLLAAGADIVVEVITDLAVPPTDVKH